MCLDDQLTFNEHVKSITVKCARQINAMGRLSKKLDIPCKRKILDAFILSNFNYCAYVYHFCGTGNSNKMEKLLERALRYVYLDFDCSYKSLLLKSGKSSLYVNRIKDILISVHKIMKDLMPPMDQGFFEISPSVYSKRYIRLKHPHYNTISYGRNSLRYQGAKLFNELCLTTEFNCLKDFKVFVNNWKPKCSCGSCLLCLK